MALAAVVGLRHQPDARPHLAPGAELPPEHLQREARRTHLADALQARQVLAALARGRRHARLARLLQRGELLLRQCQPLALAQQPFTQLGRQRRAVVALHLVTGEPAGKGLVVDLIPAAERDQQFAYAVAVLLHFLLQLPAIAHQLARGLVLWRRHVHHVHAVALAAQPCTQVGDQFDDIEPVGLRAPLVAFDRNARWIDDVALDAARLQRATDPERILAGFVADAG